MSNVDKDIIKVVVLSVPITDTDCEAVINATSSTLIKGGVVDDVIHRAAGSMLKEELKAVKRFQLVNNCLAYGQAASTEAYGMENAKKLLHTAGPSIIPQKMPTRIEEHQLRMCYLSSFQMASDLGCVSIAIPVISAGEFHYPIDQACAVLLQSVLLYIELNPSTVIRRFVIADSGEKVHAEFEKVMPLSLELTFRAQDACDLRCKVSESFGMVCIMYLAGLRNIPIQSFSKRAKNYLGETKLLQEKMILLEAAKEHYGKVKKRVCKPLESKNAREDIEEESNDAAASTGRGGVEKSLEARRSSQKKADGMETISKALKKVGGATTPLKTQRSIDAVVMTGTSHEKSTLSTVAESIVTVVVESVSITDTNCEAVINAANSILVKGGGVDDAIHKAAGKKLNEELETIKRDRLLNSSLAYGQAVPTEAYGMKASKKIIHTAGPSIEPTKKPTRIEEHQLRMCYLSSFQMASELGCVSIAIPVISAGVFHYPMDQACGVLLQSILLHLELNPSTVLRRFVIANLGRKVTAEFRKVMSPSLQLTFIIQDAAEIRQRVADAFSMGCLVHVAKLKNISIQSFTKRANQHAIENQVLQSKMAELETAKEHYGRVGKRLSSARTRDSRDTRKNEEEGSDGERATTSASPEVIENDEETTKSLLRQRDGMVTPLKAHPRPDDMTTPSKPQSITDTMATPTKPQFATPSLSKIGVPFSTTHNDEDMMTPQKAAPPKKVLFGRNSDSAKKKSIVRRSEVPMRASEQAAKKASAIRKARKPLFSTENITNARATKLDEVRELKAFLMERIANAEARVVRQLEADIVRPDGISDEDHAARQVGRMSFHLSHQREEDEDAYRSLNDVYPTWWKEFVGIQDQSTDDNPIEANEVVGTEPPQTVHDDGKEAEQNPVEKQVVEEAEGSDRNEDVEGNQDFEAFIPNPEILEPLPKLIRAVKDKDLDEMVQEIEEMLADEFGAAVEEAIEKNDKLYLDIAKEYVKGRRCDDRCPPFEAKEAEIVRRLMMSKLREVERVKIYDASNMTYTISGMEMTVADFLEEFADCYQGIRTLRQRFSYLKTLSNIVARCVEALDGEDMLAAENILKLDTLPQLLRKKFMSVHMERKDQTHHTLQYVTKKYGKLEKAFRENLANRLDTNFCGICHCSQRNCLTKKVYEVEEALDLTKGQDQDMDIYCCKSCWKYISKKKGKKVPPNAEKNGFRAAFRKTPQVVEDLNVIETFLIQLVRPVQRIMNLHNVVGKATNMRACNGIMVIIPTTLEATVDHVIKTLPSAANLTLNVRTAWQKTYVVDMKKVIAALKWLKDNNPFYADITIDEKFNFELNENVVFADGIGTQDDVNYLVKHDDGNDDGHVLRKVNYDELPIRDVRRNEKDGKRAAEVYELTRQRYLPLSITSPNLDMLCFPKLFPYGVGGMDSPRDPSISFTKYVRTLLLHEDRKFATCIAWLCFMYGYKCQKAMLSMQGLQARINPGMKSREFNPIADAKVAAQMSSILRNLRGTSEYWRSVQYKVRRMVTAYGDPTWFVTLNPNEAHWADLVEIYRKMYPEATAENIKKIIAKDPAHFSIYWRNRVKAFMDEVLLAKDGPLGEVTHYFYRVEYQHRGTQHVHCLFWTKDRPPPNASPSVITDFLDKHITARLPDETEEKETYDLINQCQKHWEGHVTCKQRRVYKGRHYTNCRFGFPKDVTKQTLYRNEDSKLDMPGFGQRPYTLARRTNEQWINDYNTAIIKAWGGNVDVQYIKSNGSKSSSDNVINYICAYTTKGEKAKKRMERELDKCNFSGKTESEVFFKKMKILMENREVGMLELIDDLLGHENHASDEQCVFIPNDPPHERTQILKPARKTEKDPDACVVEESWSNHHYANRDESLEEFSMYTCMTNLEVHKPDANSESKQLRPPDAKDLRRRATKKKEKQVECDEYVDSNDDDYDSDDNRKTTAEVNEPCTEYHYDNPGSAYYDLGEFAIGAKFPIKNTDKFMRKKKRMLGRFFLPVIVGSDAKPVEDFYRRLCIMFMKWRDESNFKAEHNMADATYMAIWKANLDHLHVTNKEAYLDLKKTEESFRAQQQKEKEAGQKLDARRKIDEHLDIEENAEELLEVQERVVDVQEHDATLKAMNSDQSELFEYSTERIRENVKTKKKPLRLFCSGTAGTGKSFMINAIGNQVTIDYPSPKGTAMKPSVLIAAPTGIAALAVNGNTCHSLFSIEVQKQLQGEFASMRSSARDQKRELFSNVKLVIIDEISMCSNVMLLKIHMRLKEITGCDDWFGGLNVIVFGDLLQLPPVKAQHVFQPISDSLLRNVFGGMRSCVNLWRLFEYRELTQNMRQAGALVFAAMLGRFRIQSTMPEDVAKLKERLINGKDGGSATVQQMAEYFIRIMETDPHAMALFPTNDLVWAFNEAITASRNMAVRRIKSRDYVHDSSDAIIRSIKKNKKKRPYQQGRFSLLNKAKKRKDGEGEIVDVKNIPGSEKKSSGRMEGGLAEEVVLAVNCRVMLRRNLKVRDMLVNGATGTLVEIVDDENGEAHILKIRFDKRPDVVQEIQRVSVMYTKSRDEIMVRNQFPVVMAFAATIHKAQGLTLKNVLISTKDIFSPCQFFVAASRVTTFEGLHLADLDETKIFTDKLALEEYNRLRATRDLPPCIIANPSLNKKKNGNWAENLRLHVDVDGAGKKVEDGGRKKSRASTKSAATRKNRNAFDLVDANRLRDLIPEIVVDEMTNTDESLGKCAMAITHTMAMMEHVYEAIRDQMDDEEGAPEVLRKRALERCVIRSNSILGLTRLWMARNPGSKFNSRTLENFFTFCMEELPTDIAQLFSFVARKDVRCNRCAMQYPAENVEYAIVLNKSDTSGNIDEAVEERFATSETNFPCESIDCDDGTLTIKSHPVFDKQNKYIVVMQPIAGTVFKAPHQDKFTILGLRCIMVGGVKLKINDDTTEWSSEYWYRNPDGGWFKQVDCCTTVSRNIVMADMNIMVFKRVPMERKTVNAENGEDLKVYDEQDDLKNHLDIEIEDYADDEYDIEDLDNPDKEQQRMEVLRPIPASQIVNRNEIDDTDGEDKSRRDGRGLERRPPPLPIRRVPSPQLFDVEDDVVNDDIIVEAPYRRPPDRRPLPPLGRIADMQDIQALLFNSSLPMRNDCRSNCFMNTALNLLFACVEYRKELELSPNKGTNEVWLEVARIFIKMKDSANDLRNLLHNDDGRQHDAGESINSIINAIPDLHHHFMYHNGEFNRPNLVREARMTQNMTLQRLMDANLNERDRVGDLTNYHVVLLNNDSGKHIRNFSAYDEYNMMGARWRVIAYSLYERHSEKYGEAGHYRSYALHLDTNTWIHVNNMDVEYFLDVMPISVLHTTCFVFERIREVQVNNVCRWWN